MKFPLKYSLIFLFALLFLTNCKEKAPDLETTQEFETYLQEEMEDQGIPAISSLIFKEDQILHEVYLGESNFSQSLELAQNHVFLLASVSKVVTATALLQLYEQGEFGLNDKVNDHLPFEVQIPNYSTPVTFQMLLTHTSGIADGPSLDGQYYYGQDPQVTLKDFLQNYFEPTGTYYDETENFHDFEPGTAHEYSNIGAALIGLLVEEISGVGFNTYCKQNIFTPLGMSNTFWRLDEINQPIVTPYNFVNNTFEEIQHYTFTDYPNGGLRSNSRDMFTFLSAFAQGGTANGHQLLQTTTVNAMTTLQIPDLNNEMGLHLFYLNPENNIWGHDGGEQGVATIMGYNPTTKVGAILLTNQGESNLDAMLVAACNLGAKL